MKSRFRRIGLPIGLFALVAGSIALTLLVGSSSANTAPDTQTLSPTNTRVFVQSPNAPTPPIGALGGPGYWKNHLANSKVGGPFYSTDCANVSQSGGSCSTSGPWALQYLSQSLGSFPVSDIIIAAQVFNAASCSSSKDQDAIGCLAGQLLATKLNLANGSLQCPGILQTVANADAFLNNQTVNGTAGINYTGPSGTYTLTAAQRSVVVSWKDQLSKYNSNGRCPVPIPQPTIVTQVSTTTAIVNQTSIADQANLTGPNGIVTGSVAFFVCGPTGGQTPCVSGGASAGTKPLSGGVATSDAFTPTAAGTYCFRVEYTSDSAHYSASITSVTTNECFTAVEATATPTPTPNVTPVPTLPAP